MGNRFPRTGLLAWCLLAAPLAAHALTAGDAAVPTSSAAVSGFASGARLALRWELQGDLLSEQKPRRQSQAHLTLANHDSQPLPPLGWSLYFNCNCRIVTGPLPSKLVLEHTAGDLYRLRPGAGFAGIAPGGSLDIEYVYPGPVINTTKAPTGPYLVYDAAPASGVAITDYEPRPIVAAALWERHAGASHGDAPGTPATAPRPAPNASAAAPAPEVVPGRPPLVTPADTYRRNAGADFLAPAAIPPVLPTPLDLRTGPGQLTLRAQPTVTAPPSLATEAAAAKSLFPSTLPAGGPPLRLSIGKVPGQASREAYTLTIRADSGIAIIGNSAAGVFYGLQSLRDLLPLPGTSPLVLPEVTITDAPRFGYRGFQLDVARNFHKKETVFKWLDLMARYKLNTLHFHLTDDEGWRLEIAGLPELTAIGAVRGHSDKPGQRLQPAYGSGPDPRDPGGSGHYTRADYIEILRYAAARHIDVIPEIEMPGHARAAVQAMEARCHRLQAAGRKDAAQYLLNDFQDRSVYSSAQLYNDNVMNPGLESTYTFIGHVIRQVAALHRAAGVPLRTIHVGGDELAHGAWEQSPASQELMKKHKLANVADLWDYFYDRVDGMLRHEGMFASGWEELAARQTKLHGHHKLIPNPRFSQRGFRAWVWNNTEGAEDFAYRLANAGYDIVLAPVTRMYMDQSYNANPEEPGVNWGGYIELEDVYGFIPFDFMKNATPAARIGKDGLTDDGRAHVLGLEATVFSETMRDPATIDYLVMPRLLAVAERAWAPDPAWATEPDPARSAALYRGAWSGFVNALGQRVLPRLDLEGANVAYRLAPPGLWLEGDEVQVNHVLPGVTLRYTTDGSLPTPASRLVAGPIREHGTIQVAAFTRDGRRGLVARLNRP